MLGEWQSETGKTWRKKTLCLLALYFSACPYTPPCMGHNSLHVSLTAIHTRSYPSLELTQKILPLDELWP
jgi:hypothetical protein